MQLTTLSLDNNVSLLQLPKLVLKGYNIEFTILEDEFLAGIDPCMHILHAKIIWSKGATHLTIIALRSKLTSTWKDLGKWGVISFWKGFYDFFFSCLEDVNRIRSIASWNLNPGIMKLFAWTRDFNPNLQNSLSAQVWIRIYGLSLECWHPKILFATTIIVGTPIRESFG